MSQQGVQTTTITLADGPNELGDILARIAKVRPDIARRLPSMTTMWEESYEISKDGQRELAKALARLLP